MIAVPSYAPGALRRLSQVALPRSVDIKGRTEERAGKPPPGFGHRFRMSEGMIMLREKGNLLAR